MAEGKQLPKIPPEIEKIIIPDQDLSVLDFLQFWLPGASQAFNGSINLPEKFLSSLAPSTISMADIQAIPTPPLAVLNTLIYAKDYWVQVLHLQPLKKKWVNAQESLQKQGTHRQCTEDTRALIKKVYNKLACISWASNMNGFPATITTDHLATYLTKNWLSDEHENQMLHLLKCKVLRKQRDNGISICDTFFIKRLINIHQMANRMDHHATVLNYAWIWERDKNWQPESSIHL
ncbi:hypothetical protein CVT25_010268 [Psilocybe cyanescens]|uniref:Uncharacterized protein n=1 Tax=Psilocybe cyanescens TaxID=93625 RepID=A0A409XDW3_PSICY|nr:hypothetical protein CVT25_010268 [Psilocybe cyanescens]